MTTTYIMDALKTYDTIIIHRHVRPDPDAIGSQAALKAIIADSFPDKNVYITGEVPPSLAFLAEMDDVSDSEYDGALVIVCDTANTTRISDERYRRGDMVIKIDHHPIVEEYAEISWVNTQASSTSEMIYELFIEHEADGLEFGQTAARLLYAGIVGDTGRFLFPSTTPKTLKYAADLVRWPFDRSALYDGMYDMQHNIARLQGYILQHYTVASSGLSSIKLTKDLLETFDVDPEETSQFVGVLGGIEGIQAWVFFIEEDETIRVRLRSKGPAINQIAADYNGGGHPMAAGASVDNWMEADKLISDLDAACQAHLQR